MNEKTICLDFDGVLAYYTEWDGTIGNPNPEGIKLAMLLHDNGYKIIIQSCRTHSTWGKTTENLDEMKKWLEKNSVPYDEIESGNKAFAHIYVDDRAINFPANKGPASQIFEQISEFLTKGDNDE